LKKNISYYDYNKATINNKRNYYCNKCKHLHTKETLQQKYGHGIDNVMKIKNIKEKHIKSLEKIDYNKANEKRVETNKKLYGVEYVQQNKDIHAKTLKTNKELYNTDYIFLSDENRKKSIKNSNTEKSKKTRLNNLITSLTKKLKTNNINLLDYNGEFYKIECDKHHIFEIKDTLLYSRKKFNNTLCTICNPIGLPNQYESALNDYLSNLNIIYNKNDRYILDGKELDIYIPSKNIAIEFNGLYWHSEIYKDKNYHLEKTLKCQEKGIRLLHIWEDEWVFKQDIVKSIILNRLCLISEKIYARQCEIRIVEDSKKVRQFLDVNHIQGYSQSSIKLGLYYENNLVSLMTFGYRHTNSKKEFELIRFCNKINLNIVGAASKLFKYFKSKYEFTELISYSDFRLFDGQMYETLGFTKQHLSKPDYFWCKKLERKHRFNYNKQKLIKEGYDSNKTEVEIMHERGYFRLFGCGQYRWVYKNI
jgi:G:T-mismatch repair DNA endonuclease (very short patch repair protein)